MCNPNRTRSYRPELLMVVTVLVGALVSVAANGLRAPEPASFFVLTPQPSETPRPTPTGGWWGEEEFTEEKLPFIATLSTSLPGIPKLELGIVTGMPRAGQPVPYEVVSCPEGQVRITSIVTGKPGWWEVTGTAPAPPNWYWKSEISSDGQHWTLLYSSRQPVTDGVLLRFLTTTVPKGTYLLRVMLVDHAGNYPDPCVVRITT